MEDKRVSLTSCFPYVEIYYSLLFPFFFVRILFYLSKWILCIPSLCDIRRCCSFV